MVKQVAVEMGKLSVTIVAIIVREKTGKCQSWAQNCFHKKLLNFKICTKRSHQNIKLLDFPTLQHERHTSAQLGISLNLKNFILTKNLKQMHRGFYMPWCHGRLLRLPWPHGWLYNTAGGSVNRWHSTVLNRSTVNTKLVTTYCRIVKS